MQLYREGNVAGWVQYASRVSIAGHVELGNGDGQGNGGHDELDVLEVQTKELEP